VIALDTNILVYARRREAPHHEAARRLLEDLAEGVTPWAIPWPCLYEFLRIVTHPRIFDPPTPLSDALEDVGSLLASPSLMVLSEARGHVTQLTHLARHANARGNLIHDVHIAAICVQHGVSELLTCDRDFARFAGVRWRDPFAT